MTPAQAGQPDFARRMQERHARQMQEMQQDMEEMRRWAEENKNRSIQQALRATDEQWRRLKPKLDRIERLKAEAMSRRDQAHPAAAATSTSRGRVSCSAEVPPAASAVPPRLGSGSVDIMDPNGGSANAQSRQLGRVLDLGSKSRMEMTEGEILCDELQRLLQGQSVPPAEIAQKVAALRKVRAQAREDLAKARTELRTLISPQQEPALIVMGYLD